MTTALLLVWMAAPPVLLEVRSEHVDGRSALVVVAAAPLGDVSVRRDGGEVVMSLAATAPASMAMPEAHSPVEAIRLERTPAGVQLRLRIAADVPHELRRESDRVVLLLGAAPAVAPPPSSTDLYRGLFPPSAGDEAGGIPRAVPPGAPEAPLPADRAPEPRREGFGIGNLIVRPSVTFDYVDADVSVLDTPEAVRDRYAQARPTLVLELPLRDGSLQVGYEARIRAYSAFDEVNGVSHLGNARIEYAVGPAIRLRGLGHFARGVLETGEVDPGREYFFGLGHFTRRQFGAGVRFETGGRFDADVEGGLDNVDVDDESGFFDYERRGVRVGLGAEMGPERRASLVYGFEQVPTSRGRPEAESKVHSVSAMVDGEIMPLLSGRASIGYTRRLSPRAPPEGQRFNGLTFGAQLRRDFGRSMNLALSANRSTELSAFEENSFYVTTSFQAVLTAPLPYAFALTAGTGYHVNRYRTTARTLGAPRRDAIADWLVGLGRTLSRWAFVRADYRHDRRDSNLDFFDQSTHAFYLELGLGFFAEGTRR
jgi:putative beta-barrel porin BBP2